MTQPNTKWSHLPNAAHIDRVLASNKSHQYMWAKLKEAHTKDRAHKWRNARTTVILDAKHKGVWSVLLELIRNVISPHEAQIVVKNAILCLIAYDDCAHMLDSEVGELRILAAFGDEKAILLLPACTVLKAIKELKNVN